MYNNTSLYCVEFIVERIETNENGLTIRQVEFKLDSFEWLTLISGDWNGVGRRCYVTAMDGFLEEITHKKLRIRAAATDESLHLCDVPLASIYNSGELATCRGQVNLYCSKTNKHTVSVRLSLRIFNVDVIHDSVFPFQSPINVNRSTQTTSNSACRSAQTHLNLRNVATQSKIKAFRSISTSPSDEISIVLVEKAVQCDELFNPSELRHLVFDSLLKVIDARLKQLHRKCTHRPIRSNIHSSVEPYKVSSPRNRCMKNSLDARKYHDGFVSRSADLGFNVNTRYQLLRTLDRIIANKRQVCDALRTAPTSIVNAERPITGSSRRLCTQTPNETTVAAKKTFMKIQPPKPLKNQLHITRPKRLERLSSVDNHEGKTGYLQLEEAVSGKNVKNTTHSHSSHEGSSTETSLKSPISDNKSQSDHQRSTSRSRSGENSEKLGKNTNLQEEASIVSVQTQSSIQSLDSLKSAESSSLKTESVSTLEEMESIQNSPKSFYK
ncbi:hypothetical protein AB6A40_002322 [Gnathostoma spinigerum]|uniref:Uncharacterized protein n=1 Tax=Gnathostoma spinigerum TaxID=75299 RepID=A0ABD6EFD7_9BILA